MEPKKNEALDLDKKRPLFLNIGLVMALSLVIAAFNWRGVIEGVDIEPPEEVFEPTYEIPITRMKEPEPPKPKVIRPKPQKSLQAAIIVETDLPESIIDEMPNIDVEPDIDLSPAFTEDYVEEVDDEPLLIVEDMPSFPGGIKAFYKYVSENISYPRLAKQYDVSGRVLVQFVIDKDGSISEVQTMKGVGFGCDEVAEEVIKNSPKWNPGKQRGNAVRVRMVLPISFSLN